MRHTDYDGPLHRDYARGRALTERQYAHWTDTFARYLPERRPLAGLDLGSGTGRLSPRLADVFGPVVAVEPAEPMRATALRDAAHPQVHYLAGRAEAIPAEDGSFDYCLLYLVWHHVSDPVRAASEVARVLRPGGVLLCRTQFADRMPDLWWLRHFPHGAEVDAAMYRRLDEELALFATAGLEPAPGAVEVAQPTVVTKREQAARLRTRALSTLARMDDADFATGMAALEADAARDPDTLVAEPTASLLVLRRP